MTARVPPPLIAGEREMLRTFLGYHRVTLAMTCAGLPDAGLRRRSVPPSGLSPLAPVGHMAEVERFWSRRVTDREEMPLLWPAAGGFQAAHDDSMPTRDEAFAAWEEEPRHSRRTEAARSASRRLTRRKHRRA